VDPEQDGSLETSAQVDRHVADWSRVSRAVYQVRHHYRYSYTGPVTDLRQRLIMIPPARHEDQRLLASHLAVRGDGGDHTISWEGDHFGNQVCHVQASRVDHAVDFEATYRVERSAKPGGRPVAAGLDGAALGEYLQATALTAPDAQLRAAARRLEADATSPRVVAERVHDWAAGAISYQLGVTGVQTPAAMALHLGRGVCQDYAHIMLCMLRLLGVPARYVSGHLLGEGAPHAWVEALVEEPDVGIQVIPYDPTHHRQVGLNYIIVAVGRDYADITPTSGFFSGPAAGRLSSSKQADVVELSYAGPTGGGTREDAA
jgi:transglutaminase-like putative cysteine protease